MNSDDILKLEAVEDYTLSELKTIIIFLEGGMFCDWIRELPYSELITGED